jgi:TonB family protein
MARNMKYRFLATLKHYVHAVIATVAVFVNTGCESLPDPIVRPDPVTLPAPITRPDPVILPIRRHWDCPMSLNKTAPEYVDEMGKQVMINLQIPPDTPDDALSVYGVQIRPSGRLFKTTLISGSGNKEFDIAVENALQKSQYPPVPNISYGAVIEAASIAFSANRTARRVDKPSPTRRFPNIEPTVKPSPIYPRDAVRSNVEGSVFVEATVSPAGDVTDVTITSAEPPGVFDQAVKDAILKFKFEKKPNMFGIQQRFTFCIDDIPPKIPAPPANIR